MAFGMSIEERKAFLSKISIILALIETLSIGVINSVYSDTRWPTSKGAQLLLDFVYVSFSNPYALLSGVLVYLLFQRWSKNVHIVDEETNQISLELTKVDFLIIGILLVWTYVLMQGIIVY